MLISDSYNYLCIETYVYDIYHDIQRLNCFSMLSNSQKLLGGGGGSGGKAIEINTKGKTTEFCTLLKISGRKSCSWRFVVPCRFSFA